MFAMSSPERLDGRALVLIAIALLTWSSAYAAIAYALVSFSPGEVALARLSIGALCFGVLMMVRRTPLPQRCDWPQLALLGVLGLTIYHLALNYAETRIASGTAAILSRWCRPPPLRYRRCGCTNACRCACLPAWASRWSAW
jgi:drug/metabolite transporter (DMT)-like permease